MTVKLSVSLPDDVAAFLQQQANVSGYVADAVRDRMPEARRARMREAVALYARAQALKTPEEIENERFFTEHSNELSARGAEWD